MNCLIVAGGVKPKDEVIKYYSKKCELIIGVDKGCNYLFEAKVKPQYIVGDFDSSNLDIIDEIVKQGVVKYKYVSFLAYNNRIEEFSIRNAKYLLDKYSLEIGDSRTVSNEFIDDEIALELSNGSILVVYSKD